jgi:hypothetical protein
VFMKKHPRLIALLGTAGVTASLIGVAVAGTGAYFTDSHPGNIDGNNGDIAISVSGGSGTGGLDFDFSGILPGVPKTATVTVSNLTANPEAVWLVFDNSNGMWSAVNNLGRYGIFTVGGYVYNNLTNKAAPTDPGVLGSFSGTFCGAAAAPSRSGYNYLPHAIKITTLPAWGTASFPITFEYHACMTNHQGESIFNALGNDIGGTGGAALIAAPNGPLLFNVAAFQDGIDPTSLYNGSAAITPLNLSTYGTSQDQYIQY